MPCNMHNMRPPPSTHKHTGIVCLSMCMYCYICMYIRLIFACVVCVCCVCVCVRAARGVCFSLFVSLSLCLLFLNMCAHLFTVLHTTFSLSFKHEHTNIHSQTFSLCQCVWCESVLDNVRKRACRHVHGHSWCRVYISLSLSPLSDIRIIQNCF
jgi:hypothetical protein